MEHVWLTVIATLPDDKIEATQKKLDDMGNPAHGPIHEGLMKTERVHFASMVIIPGDSVTPTHLVLELSGDGPQDELLASLEEHAGSEIRDAFQHTNDYSRRERLSKFLDRRHQSVGIGIFAGLFDNPPGLNHTGTPGASVKQILIERDIAKETSEILRDAHYDTASEMVNHARRRIRAMPQFKDSLEPKTVMDWDREEKPLSAFNIGAMVLSAIEYFLWLPLLVFFTLVLHYKREDLYGDLTKISAFQHLEGWSKLAVNLVSVALSFLIACLIAAALAAIVYFARRWPFRLIFSALFLVGAIVVLWFANPPVIASALGKLPNLFSFDNFPWLILVGSIVLLLLGAVLLVAIVFASLRRLENRDQADDPDLDQVKIADIMQRENHTMQNHMVGISTMKGGCLRELAMRASFWLIGQLAERSFRPGFLGEIGTIHFARWIRLPGTNRLLFFSNYGGSWESYLEDFITKASEGLTAIWSNTIGYPETKNLFQAGAEDGDRFKRWARHQMVPTPFWFTAYPELRTENIRRNADIREGLAMAMSENKAEDWLMKFGAAPRPAEYIEGDDIQKLVFGGMKRLAAAAAMIVSLPDGQRQKANAWLQRELDDRHLSFGETQPDPATGSTMIAFTHDGLRKMGLQRDELSSFPPVFQSGMTAPHRARVLGDLEQNAPNCWAWGGTKTDEPGNPPKDPERPLDAILLVYAKDAAALEEKVAGHQARLQSHGLKPAQIIKMRVLPLLNDKGEMTHVSTEPFGFVDGISQPIIRGTARARVEVNAMHLVAPGEIVLGYPDNRGYMPPTPRVSAIGDPNGILHEVKPGGKTKKIADFDLGGLRSKDFGRNGTFLVVRQLQQNVQAFEEFLDSAAEQLKSAAGDASEGAGKSKDYRREWVAAKMIGRWRNGSPLVTHPDKPTFTRPKLQLQVAAGIDGKNRYLRGDDGVMERDKANTDNTFLYGTGDPQGLRCPYGAHIRRAFPRESQRPGQAEQIEIVKRHRILRIGRPYLDKEEGEEGLLFMCLNADIERQFEFIQQTWLNSTTFHGLNYESDPIMGVELDVAGAEKEKGRLEEMGRFTIPTARGPKVITGLSNFVQVIGGGYFFMPSRRALQFLSVRH